MAFAQNSSSSGERSARPARNVAGEIAEPLGHKPGLPSVLIIGDSISIGYTTATRALLAGKFNVYRAPMNCGPTTRGLARIDEWLGTRKWDVIQFNFGLHDLGYVDKRGAYDIAGIQRVPRREYGANLEKIVERLEMTGALLIWAATTPVPEGSPGRFKGDELHYNRIAAEIMKRHGILINDLHAAAMERLGEIQLPRNVHYRPEGYRFFGGKVAGFIEEAWKGKEKEKGKKIVSELSKSEFDYNYDYDYDYEHEHEHEHEHENSLVAFESTQELAA